MSPYTRRDFAKLALTAVPAVGLFSTLSAAADSAKRAGKPNSKVNGVQIGLNVPYSFKDLKMSGDETLEKCLQLGVSGVELRAQPVEKFLGVPADAVDAKGKTSGAAAEKMRAWRKTISMDRVKPFRKKWDDAGVKIEILKVDGIFKMSDEELDYAFGMAKTLGARAISSEVTHNDDELKHVGMFAQKHGSMIGLHGHATMKPEDWEHAFTFGDHIGANVDLGHFVAGNNVSPAEFLKKYHARVTHVHVKDRKKNAGPNMPFGQGDTPIVDILHLIRDNKWPMQATIEFEYPIPEGSDRMSEIAKAIQYCRDALA